MRGTVYLGGGGSDADEAKLWHEAFPDGSTVAVWPFALSNIERRRAAGKWLTSSLAALGSFEIDVWLTADVHDGSLDDTDVVAIPGGNTFELLNELRRSGLFEVLLRHLTRGGRLYGGSAGAVLTGADIAIAQVADRNDVDLQETGGLDLLHGCDVLPHYTVDQADLARGHAKRTGRHVLCLPERSGVIISADDTVRNVGPDPVYVVTAADIEEHPAGHIWSSKGAR